ncbi:MAG: hypothetical protein ACRC2V_10250 [Xenococcaceae cyanobacterium]|nr:hypothetical protein B7486_51865 [cyanobacterium TDX16]
MKITKYFEQNVLQKRPEIRENWQRWCQQVIANPLKREVQPDGRIRFWGQPSGVKNILRVVTLEDGETIHNAFFDRDFLKQQQKGT